MTRLILGTIFLCLTLACLGQSEYYAVLICGDTPDLQAAGVKNWNGAAEPGYDEFWNDTYLMWEMLWQYGWKDENIFVLFGYGNDWTGFPNERYWGNQWQQGWGIEHVTDSPAYLEDVEDVFAYLDGIMTEQDFLFVWTFDHGNTWAGGSSLCLMD